jgi:hypothetical protein
MRVSQHPAEAARHAAAIVRRHLPDPSSRATGPEAVPSTVLAAIDDELDEAPTLYTIEIVDFARVSQAFRSVARERIPLFPRGRQAIAPVVTTRRAF